MEACHLTCLQSVGKTNQLVEPVKGIHQRYYINRKVTPAGGAGRAGPVENLSSSEGGIGLVETTLS